MTVRDAKSQETRTLPSVEERSVRVVHYDPSWPRLYAFEAPVVAKAFGNRAVELEHFGSTAVPGLDAKPIVDILAGSSEPSPPDQSQIEALLVEGYVFLGEDGRRPGRWFWRKRGSAWFNLSLVSLGGDLWKNNLLVRDFLRAHADEARAYAEVKREAVRASPDSLLGYQEHKRDYMQILLSRAQQWDGAGEISGDA